MGAWEEQYWEPTLGTGVPRRERRSGAYASFLPNLLTDCSLTLSSAASITIAQAEAAVRTLDRRSAQGLASLSRFLLRSEAIASSRIEGVTPSARNVALAELGQSEAVSGLSDAAVLVANTMTAVRDATSRLAEAPEVTVAHLIDLQASLLADSPALTGLRTRQNWIGGSSHHPLDADFVPPAPEHVGPLLEDLVTYVNGAAHSPLVQAALVHAQFETIHPFPDGNGRVGRTIIHTVLTRRGLTADTILPVSLALATFSREYIRGLSAFRAVGSSTHPDVVAGTEQWILVFTEAVRQAAQRAVDLADDIAELRDDWQQRLEAHRTVEGRTRGLRSGSASAAILDGLPGTPVLTAATAARIHCVSDHAARTALESLVASEILDTAAIGRGRRAYVSTDLLNLISTAERRLASTRFDTRLSPPNRPVPARRGE